MPKAVHPFNIRRVRALAGASFLLVGFAVGNWPARAGGESAGTYGASGPITGTAS
jgi:hypothetical protein